MLNLALIKNFDNWVVIGGSIVILLALMHLFSFTIFHTSKHGDSN